MKKSTLDRIAGRGTKLRWRMILVLLITSLVPLSIAGFGSWIVFGKLLERKSIELMRTLVEGHARAIESYLMERVNLMQLLSESHAFEEISNTHKLRQLLSSLNKLHDDSFIDLGVIDPEGRHVAYVGPFDLHDKNYHETEWFAEVMEKGVYISDIFLGYRQIPHCIIAIKSSNETEPWILRATINSEQFDQLVKTAALEKESDIYIVNREGIYQTTPRLGNLLDRAIEETIEVHTGLREHRVTQDGIKKIKVTTWINNDRWMLVVEQDLAAVQEPVNKAIAEGAKVVIMAFIILISITLFATWHLTKMIDRAVAERDELSRAFIRSAKLASIGELATGLAHEINNPLAVISAEQTNIKDIVEEVQGGSGDLDGIRESVERSKNQVKRCAEITKKMLLFGRSLETTIEPTDVKPRLKEIVDLLQRRANLRNARLALEIQENLPEVLVDPIELEQVIVNLINNSLDALPEGGQIKVRAFGNRNAIYLTVEDNGTGIPKDHIDRVFEPFFTTKPVGKGTGLGLSVCYGIVRSWGGRISIESSPQEGTTVEIMLPLDRSQKVKYDRGGLS